MKTAYGIRLAIALLVGALAAGTWLYFFFDLGIAKLEPVFGTLAWQGAARLLVGVSLAGALYVGFHAVVAIVEIRDPKLARKIALIPSRLVKWEKRTAGFNVGNVLIVLGGLFVFLFIIIPTVWGILRTIFAPAVYVILVLGRPEWQGARAETTATVAWIFAKGFVIPTALFFVPYQWVRLMERLNEHPLFRRLFVHGRGGSARWAGALGFSSRRHADGGNLFVGRTMYWDVGFSHRKDVGLGDDAHMLTIGCTGSGKSVTVIWPNLARYEGGIVILDPKGEHAKMTYWRRTTAGLAEGKCHYTTEHFAGAEEPRAYKLDPFKQEESIPPSRYNPLSEINIDDDRVLEKLAAISDGCVLPEGDKNQHWVEGARTILEGVMAHVLSRETPENCNLPYVHDLLLGFDATAVTADADLSLESPLPTELEEPPTPEAADRFEALLESMKQNSVVGGICIKAAKYIAHDTRGNMMTTVIRSIKWMGDPAMRKHLSAPSDFKFADVPKYGGSAGNTVYIVAPIGPLMKEQVRWLRVLTNLSITIIRLCRKPTQRTLFILDEFPQLQGKLTAVEEGIVTLRSAHVRLWPFIQQIGQLKKDYGANWNTFISSSNIQAFGVTDPETAEWLSEGMLGGTLHFRKEGNRLISDGPRPLLTAREVMTELGKNEPRAIVIPNDGGFPMRLERMAHKPMLIEGKRFGGLLLEGYFEEEE